MKIYKQSLRYGKTYRLPKYLNVNHFGIQANQPCVWYLYDEDEPATFSYKLHSVPTGGEVPDDIDMWLGTIVLDNGSVLHYFLKRV